MPRDYIHDVEWLFTEKTKEALKKKLEKRLDGVEVITMLGTQLAWGLGLLLVGRLLVSLGARHLAVHGG